MTKHKTEDYKISAVKYYLNNDKGDGYKKTCKIYEIMRINSEKAAKKGGNRKRKSHKKYTRKNKYKKSRKYKNN